MWGRTSDRDGPLVARLIESKLERPGQRPLGLGFLISSENRCRNDNVVDLARQLSNLRLDVQRLVAIGPITRVSDPQT